MPDDLMKILEDCPVPLPAIAEEAKRGEALGFQPISFRTLEGWAQGRRFPRPDMQVALAAALDRLGVQLHADADRVRKAQRPVALPDHKKDDRTSGRPKGVPARKRAGTTGGKTKGRRKRSNQGGEG